MSLRRNIGSLCAARDKREAGGAVFMKDAVNFTIMFSCRSWGFMLILRQQPFNVRKRVYLLMHSKRSCCASSLVGEIGTASPAS